MNTVEAEIKEAEILFYVTRAEDMLQKVREQIIAAEAELLKLRRFLMDCV